MAEVMPFAGTRYVTKEEDRNLGDVICPPFDSIDPQVHQELHERELHNVVRLVLGKQAASDDDLNNRYSRSAECYRDWKSRGILSDEQRKCFYIYEQEFTPPGETESVRSLGFFALVKLQDFRSGKIRAYEQTFETPKSDRLKLLRTTQLNESPIHMIYRDEDEDVNGVLREIMGKKPPIEEFTCPNGIRHRLWMMHKKDPILRIHQAMKPKRLVIADGHHLYETALKYRDEMREMTGRRDGRQPYDFALMHLQRAEEASTYVKPVHRVLARELGMDADLEEILDDLQEFFTLTEFKLDLSDEKAAKIVADKIKPTKTSGTRFAMVLPNGKSWILALKKDADLDEMIEEETMSNEFKALDIVLLHSYVITRGWLGNPDMELEEDDVHYREDVEDCLELLRKRKGCVAFLVNPLKKESLIQVAENGELLPHHSSEIYPKIPSGLLLRDLNVGFG